MTNEWRTPSWPTMRPPYWTNGASSETCPRGVIREIPDEQARTSMGRLSLGKKSITNGQLDEPKKKEERGACSFQDRQREVLTFVIDNEFNDTFM